DTYNYFANGESIPNEDFGLASLGLSNLGLSFSMYLKDRDPKLLDKQPAWRRKFESAKKKTGELSDRLRDWVPQPQPELAPIPIRYATQTKELEDYVR
ncbi:MAG: hypothetical protein Q8P81_03940, partial [Nanoarchaeota archaeon]|nr:hypothetical protein [Nanoarchaeota archaeon]